MTDEEFQRLAAECGEARIAADGAENLLRAVADQADRLMLIADAARREYIAAASDPVLDAAAFGKCKGEPLASLLAAALERCTAAEATHDAAEAAFMDAHSKAAPLAAEFESALESWRSLSRAFLAELQRRAKEPGGTGAPPG